jgi:DNA topoisomerase-1
MSAMTPTVDTLNDLYGDTQTCAKLIGLSYIDDDSKGLTRKRHGKGYSYHDLQNQKTVDAKMKTAIAELVIPPAWQEVWICPDQKGHILATGIDERGRKQYMYHPKWRTMRDLIKFYRMIVFGAALPKIRRDIEKHLDNPELSREKVIAAMLWILDNTYIRIGNDVYFETNESVGLTTLTDKHVVIAGPVVTLAFKGKSGKNQQITFEDRRIAALLEELRQVRGARLFRYKSDNGWRDIDSGDINDYLHELTATAVSAKDFRTWGGTLMAFHFLIDEDEKDKSMKPEKAVIAAIDQAAAILGNTRTVARSSYVHPHLLKTYGHKDFGKYYDEALQRRKLPGLETRESEMLHFLEILFEKEFDLLKD